MVKDENKTIRSIKYNHLNLPTFIDFGTRGTISYFYDATGRKVRKVVQNDVLSQNTVTDYANGFQYENNIIQFFPTAEGYASRLTTKFDLLGRLVKIPIEELPEDQFTYVYNYTDHLGNIRLSYARDPDTQQLKIVEQNHYYPFGLRHTNYSGGKMQVVKEQELKRMAPTPEELLSYKYKYNGKEWQDELGLNMYDYGARNYDAAIGRWMNVDPLAERRDNWSIFSYCLNNPILRFDYKGCTDFTFNKKTGEVKQIGEKNDEPDRILKTNRKGEIKYNKNGEAKVAVDGIEQGILKDGQNFKTNDQLIEVGGKGQPTAEGVKSFTLKLSEYIEKEIKGFSYSADGTGKVTDVLLGKYENNSYDESYGSAINLINKYGKNFSFKNIFEEFHTHPNGQIGATQHGADISKDVRSKNRDILFSPNAKFIVLYRIFGQKKPGEYDYTKN